MSLIQIFYDGVDLDVFQQASTSFVRGEVLVLYIPEAGQ